MELGQVGGVGHVMAIHLARADHVDGRLLVLHGMHLRARGLRTQQHVALAAHVAHITGAVHNVEGVLHRAAWVILGSVERREVVPVGLDLATAFDLVANAREDIYALANNAVDEMLAADGHAAARQRDVDRTSLKLGIKLSCFEYRLTFGKSRLNHIAHLVGELAHDGALLRRDITHAAQHACERSLLAKHADTHLLERIACLGLRNGGKRLVTQAFQFFLQRHPFVLSTNRPHDVRAIKNAPA